MRGLGAILVLPALGLGSRHSACSNLTNGLRYGAPEYSLAFANVVTRDDIELGSREWLAYDAAEKRPGTPAVAE